jgi:2-polyprenyl-3-methyl-5-hydroxy-6-metoxy-1,4-benzoquinol methylase
VYSILLPGYAPILFGSTKQRKCLVKYDAIYSVAVETVTYLGRYLLQYKNTELSLFLDGIDDGSRVLDYGCNDGWVSREVKRCKPQCEVSGADINPAALRKARRRGGGVEYFDARNGDLNGKTFDVVILSHVLEHVHARSEFLERVVGLIAPGGRLIVSVPQERFCGDSTLIPWAMNVLRGRFVNPHVVVLHQPALQTLLQSVGFEIDCSTYTNLFWPRVSQRRGLQSHALIVQARRMPIAASEMATVKLASEPEVTSAVFQER